MHDWMLFQLTKAQRNCIIGTFLPYRLIEDCAYPVLPWIDSPFKGCLEGIKGCKTD